MTKNIWITGASSGIGKALAIKFATEGWQVAASARRENLLQDLNKTNSNIHSFPLDVKDEAKAKKVFENIIKNSMDSIKRGNGNINIIYKVNNNNISILLLIFTLPNSSLKSTSLIPTPLNIPCMKSFILRQ